MSNYYSCGLEAISDPSGVTSACIAACKERARRIAALDPDQRAIYERIKDDPSCAECDTLSFAEQYGHMRAAFFALLDDSFDAAEAWRKIEDGEVVYIGHNDAGPLDVNSSSAMVALGSALLDGDLSQLKREELERYFNWEQYGRDQFIRGDFREDDNGDILEVIY